jgi:hypothetical protein
VTSQDLSREQAYVSMLYRRLDTLRAKAAAGLAGARRAAAAALGEARREAGGAVPVRPEFEAAVREAAGKVARFEAAESGLCFGRLDLSTGGRIYLGRIGLPAPSPVDDPVLVDWRAPAARPFYAATTAAPKGVHRRRQIVTRGRRVVSLDDQILDTASPPCGPSSGDESLAGDGALLAALTAGRTGRMADIVATLQAEQDAIIRSAHQGVLVVQGGPGTGKTAVALHRAAYLLYHRPGPAAQGVLVIGPSATFLDYVGQVLPGLGETSVRPATVAELYPGVTADRPEPAATAELKGRAVLAEVLAAAVRDRQVPAGANRLDPEVCARARAAARLAGLPHNQAREVFIATFLDELTRRLADETRGLADRLEAEVADVLAEAGVDRAAQSDLAGLAGVLPEPGVDGPEDVLTDDDIEDLRGALSADAALRKALDALWPALTPQQMLTDLFADPHTPLLSESERALLTRAPGGGWSAADVPLLDELADLLGTDADADLPGADRTWAFGHVIVDEAQELSPMAWRLVMRRCPGRSMTLVGDVAQTSDPAGSTSWEHALRPHVGDRWRLARLSVNYRTPAEVMAATADLLAAIDPAQQPPSSVRKTGLRPWRLSTSAPALSELLARHAAREESLLGDGRLAVIVPDDRVAELTAAVRAELPGAVSGPHPDLTARVVVLGVRQAKGLEFDSVLIADPAGILAASPRGRNDLYVAMTRTTRRLGILHPGPAPAELAEIPPV